MKTAWERNEFCRGQILERCYQFMVLCVQNKVCIVFTVSMVSFCVWKLHVLNWLCPMRVWMGAGAGGGVWNSLISKKFSQSESESESELLLVTRSNDNHSPGPVLREVSP